MLTIFKKCFCFYFVFSFLSIVSFSSCEKDTSPVNNEMELIRQGEAWILSTTHFQLHGSDLDRSILPQIGGYLEDHYPKITDDLQLENFSIITVRFYPDFPSFRIAIGMPQAPDWVIGMAYTKSEIRMMSFNCPDLGAGYTFEYLLSCIAHEFTHCVTMQMNHPITRWLYEGVALYESGMFVNPGNLTYIRSGDFPTLSELNSNWQTNTRIYEVGYVLIEFIVETWGMEVVRTLIMNGGNISSALGITIESFEQLWYNFIQNKYL